MGNFLAHEEVDVKSARPHRRRHQSRESWSSRAMLCVREPRGQPRNAPDAAQVTAAAVRPCPAQY